MVITGPVAVTVTKDSGRVWVTVVVTTGPITVVPLVVVTVLAVTVEQAPFVLVDWIVTAERVVVVEKVRGWTKDEQASETTSQRKFWT